MSADSAAAAARPAGRKKGERAAGWPACVAAVSSASSLALSSAGAGDGRPEPRVPAAAPTRRPAPARRTRGRRAVAAAASRAALLSCAPHAVGPRLQRYSRQAALRRAAADGDALRPVARPLRKLRRTRVGRLAAAHERRRAPLHHLASPRCSCRSLRARQRRSGSCCRRLTKDAAAIATGQHARIAAPRSRPTTRRETC